MDISIIETSIEDKNIISQDYMESIEDTDSDYLFDLLDQVDTLDEDIYSESFEDFYGYTFNKS